MIVRRSADFLTRDCDERIDCISDLYESQLKSGSISISGLTEIGAMAITPSIRRKFSDLGYELPEKVVVLEENTKPSASIISWLKLIGGVIGALLVFGTYFKIDNN